MKLPDYLRNRPVLAMTTGHWLSQLGFATLITGMVTWIILIPMRLRHGEEHPYIGVAMFVATDPLQSHLMTMPQSNPHKRLRDAQNRGMRLIVVDPRRSKIGRAPS